MTRVRRQMIVGLIMTGLGVGRPLAAATDPPAVSRVRSTHAQISALIERGSEESKTFRTLIAAVNAGDGIVYVEQGDCRAGAPACFVAVTKPGTHRFLWVKIDLARLTTDWDVIGAIGHELRHTLEVLSNETVTNSSSMYLFYLRVGRKRDSGFETQAAVTAGNMVRDEVRKYRASNPQLPERGVLTGDATLMAGPVRGGSRRSGPSGRR